MDLPKEVAREQLLNAEVEYMEALNGRDMLMLERLVSNSLTFVFDTMPPATKATSGSASPRRRT